MTVLTEKLHRAAHIVSEAPGHLSRDPVTYASGADVLAGTVLGKAGVAGATSAAKAGGNTGGGSLTLDVTTPVLAGAKAGVYRVRCTTVVANGGVFDVSDPDGDSIGEYAIGGPAFANQIKFAMADVGTDFALGDGFDITVAAGSGKVKALNLAALDGAAVAYGVAFDFYAATAADVAGVAHVRSCEVRASDLTWPVGITDSQKAAALAQLAARGVVAR